jgi:hypothetical protein
MRDNKTKQYQRDPNYDIMQHYTIKFRKAKFKDRITFIRLYCYLFSVKYTF